MLQSPALICICKAIQRGEKRGGKLEEKEAEPEDKLHSMYMHPWTMLDEEKQNTIEILPYQCTIWCISL